jgi:uncharacterized membrane protein YhaH (DUF805 family)
MSGSASATLWFYGMAGEQHGPVTVAQISALLARGTIDGTTLVWSEALPNWEPLAGTELAVLLGPAAVAQPNPGSGAGLPLQDAVRRCLQRYATFAGRAGRSEFWCFVLFMLLGNVACAMLDAAVFGSYGGGVLSGLFTLATIVPGISAMVRRLHDTDRSGWFYWLALLPLVGPLILLAFACQRGTPGPNRFG